MVKGETVISGAPQTCPDCGVTVQLEVLRSAAGYYVGTQCRCGPYTRESEEYYRSREEAERALREGTWTIRGLGTPFRWANGDFRPF